MELEGEKIDRIRTAAFVYSIGRLIIPEHVLNRAAELTKEEKRIIKKYFKISFKVCDKILKHVSGFENIVPIVRAEDERWDGKGYSNRLKGEEIPLEARIIAVVDAYQMMCSNQPYQKKLSQEEAIEELKKQAGSRFDPEVVQAFLEIIGETI